MAAKTVADKLLIKPNTSVWVSDAERLSLLEPLPDGATRASSIGEAGVATIFADDAASLSSLLATNEADLKKPAVLWVAYRKGNRADINRDTLWPMLTPYNLRPVTQIALDDVWSALRFREIKPGESFNPAGR